jgi:hypothetical protein
VESVMRTTAISLPSAVCTGLVTTRLPCISNVLPVVLQECDINPNFPAFVIFTDEAHFTRDGIQNFHSERLWADENSYAVFPSHHQQCFSIDIWNSFLKLCWVFL